MSIDRRSLLALTIGGVGAGLALPNQITAQAAAPTAGKQAPGIYRYKVGGYEVTAISDGGASRKLDETFVRNVPLADVQKDLQASFQPKDQVRITFTTLAINTGSKVIVLDTGYGDGGPASAGSMAASLAAAGIDPANVDMVVHSHFHPDHIAGTRRKDGSLTYPKAEIKVPAPEWDFWMDDAKMAQAPEGMKGNFQLVRTVFGPNAKDITRFEWEKEVAPGITAIAAPGHTPGHTAFMIQSGNAKLLVASDCTNAAFLNLRNPEWKLVFDMDPDLAIATRKRFFDMASSERAQVAAYHWPFPAVGHVVKDGTRYQLVPTNWNPVL